MRTRWFGLIVAAFVGCGDDGGSPPPADAPAVDGNALACTGAAYDPCTAPGDCDSGMCRTFQSAGLMLCTQACDGSNPCPMQNGAAVQCNNMGVCRPNAANACTP